MVSQSRSRNLTVRSMAMVFAQPKKNLLPLLLFLFCISVIILLVLVSETTHSNAGRGTTFRRNYNDPPPFTFLIKVLTFNRLHSLSRCLRSLSAADYGVSGDRGRIHLHVYIDHFNLSRNDTPVEDNLNSAREILGFVDRFEWRFGEKVVHYRTDNAGLQAQWLEAWWPSSDHEFAFVVEDDLEVSPLYYGILERMIHKYYYDTSNFSPSIYGASLQRPRFVPGKHGNKLHVDPKTNLLLYQLVGTWGQLLFPKPWKEFRLWYDEHKSNGKKPFLDGMVTNGWYKRLGERIWTPWFIKFVHSRGYFNIYTSFPNEGALSVSHRDAGVNYGKTAGPDSQLLNKSSLSSDSLKLQPLSNLKWYDFCFSEVVPGRVVRNLNELGTILPSVQREKTIILVSLYGADKMFTRNLLCHFEKLNTQNHIFIGPSSELFYDLSRRGHPVIDADMFLDKLIKSKTSYPNSVKEALGNAYVVKKCLELGYSTWAFSSNSLLIDKGPLLDRVSSEYDIYIGERSGSLIVQSSPVTQKLWSNEFLHSIASSKQSLDFIHLVNELVEQKGKRIKTVETMDIAENTNANSVNQSLGDGMPVVYWSPEVAPNMIRSKLEELNLWLIDDDLSCKAVVCHSS
ncbi:Nucleotide-diphospho-sugar transferase [Arabidopsis suecica]|uniref:Nucleotide-diphospho-sugar transferase n=1 Tax=Arabidopsis suecica TaxID=45249 RepID=A0A8T1Z9R7_ARASU|nr:Nucleotide-diphospho-sugar transferase [Arabidopsis suecica]